MCALLKINWHRLCEILHKALYIICCFDCSKYSLYIPDNDDAIISLYIMSAPIDAV